MLVYLPKRELTKFERLYMEADEKPHRNMRSIEVTEENGRRSAKINGGDTDIDVDLDEDDEVDMGEEFPVDDYDEEPNDEDYLDGDVEENPEDEDTNTAIDTEGDDDSLDTGDTEEANNDNEENTGGADIDLEGDDDNGEDTGESDDSNNDNGENSEEKSEDISEAIHKQALYRKFVRLHDATDNYITKLEDLTGFDRETNHRYNEITDELHMLKDFLFDFMIIKFKTESYPRCEYFYQRAVAVITLLLDELDSLKKELIRKRKEDARRSNKRKRNVNLNS